MVSQPGGLVFARLAIAGLVLPRRGEPRGVYDLKVGRPRTRGTPPLRSCTRSSPDDAGHFLPGRPVFSTARSLTGFHYAPEVVSEGEPAPDFSATTDAGERVNL